MILKLFAVICCLPAAMVILYLLITSESGQIEPAQLIAWDRELPVESPTRARDSQPQVNPNVGNPQQLPAESSVPVRVEDIDEWLRRTYPESYKGTAIFRAFEDVINAQGWSSVSSDYMYTCRMANDPRYARLTSTTLEALISNCASFISSRKNNLDSLDKMLAGGPLPWPAAVDFDAVVSPEREYRMGRARTYGCDLAIASAILDWRSGRSVFPAVIRLTAIDRRFHLESDAAVFMVNPSTTIDLLSQLVGEPGIGLFGWDAISAENAAEFLSRFPEPVLDSMNRRRNMLRRKFRIDRALRASPELGFQYFYLEEWDTRGFISASTNPQTGIAEFVRTTREMAHYYELKLIYRTRHEDYLQSVMNQQKKIDDAIAVGKEQIDLLFNEELARSRNHNISSTRHSEYLGLANDTLNIPKNNDMRLILHAAMTARANSQSSARALEAVRQFSAHHGNRIEAQETSQGLRLFIGERSVHIPTGAAN